METITPIKIAAGELNDSGEIPEHFFRDVLPIHLIESNMDEIFTQMDFYLPQLTDAGLKNDCIRTVASCNQGFCIRECKQISELYNH